MQGFAMQLSIRNLSKYLHAWHHGLQSWGGPVPVPLCCFNRPGLGKPKQRRNWSYRITKRRLPVLLGKPQHWITENLHICKQKSWRVSFWSTLVKTTAVCIFSRDDLLPGFLSFFFRLLTALAANLFTIPLNPHFWARWWLLSLTLCSSQVTSAAGCCLLSMLFLFRRADSFNMENAQCKVFLMVHVHTRERTVVNNSFVMQILGWTIDI